MKKLAFLLTLTLMFSLVLCGCGNDAEASEPASMPDYIDIVADDSDISVESAEVSEALCGGWNTPEDGAITTEAQAAFDKATEALTGVEYTPVALVGTQVVAGTNYAFVCIGKTVTAEPTASPYLVIVYADLEGGAELLSAKPLAVTQ